jgi:hypothetical protein
MAEKATEIFCLLFDFSLQRTQLLVKNVHPSMMLFCLAFKLVFERPC